MSYYNFSSSLFSGFQAGQTSSFSGLLGEYAQIRSGSYRRLLRNYYAKFNADGTTRAATTQNTNTRKPKESSDTRDKTTNLSTVESKASTLQTAAATLAAVKEGSSSLYAKKVMVEKNEDGTTTTRNDYDYDTLVKSVKALTAAYNETLDSLSSVSASSIHVKAKWMMDITKQSEEELSKVGISVDKDGRLSLNEETFRKADMTDIEDFFSGSNTYTAKIARKASSISGAASLQASRAASAYTATGTEYKPQALNSGTVFDSLF